MHMSRHVLVTLALGRHRQTATEQAVRGLWALLTHNEGYDRRGCTCTGHFMCQASDGSRKQRVSPGRMCQGVRLVLKCWTFGRA